MFTLINAIVGAIINVIQLILGLELPYLSLHLPGWQPSFPSLRCAIRRLHDTDRSGAWALALSGSVHWLARSFWFVFACSEGTSGSNRYGNDPKFGSN